MTSDDDRSDSRRGARPRPRYDAYLGQTPGQTLGPFFHQGLLRTRAVFQVPGLCHDERDVFDPCGPEVGRDGLGARA